ncbi:MAG: hypothetical protein EAZ30_06050 [Betaproteobacteria bacterium]|nr:MAG: hypothetical protein EAZ30_06050 [Betaproteobacteria bacterium]TAG76941.1 MAG: hypothetical protein EAZ21_15840 [Betaproteobacteria bacterium]
MATKLPAKSPPKPAGRSETSTTKTKASTTKTRLPVVPSPTSSKTEKAKLKTATKTTALKTQLTPIKVKIIRDSFTMTEADHELIKHCKKSAVAKGRETRKSEVVRAAVAAFATLPLEQQLLAYSKLTAVKTGRPRKAK